MFCLLHLSFLPTGGWELEKFVHYNISVSLKSIFLFIQYGLIHESSGLKNFVVKKRGFSGVSYSSERNSLVMAICLLMNYVTLSLVIFQIENMSSIYLLQTSDSA